MIVHLTSGLPLSHHKGTDRGATDEARQLGNRRAEELRRRIEPFMLRREKKSILTIDGVAPALQEAAFGAPQATSDVSSASASASASTANVAPSLGKKLDLIVWIRVSPTQEEIYRHFLESPEVAALLNTTHSPLAALNVLKKLCDHPRLLLSHVAYRSALGLDTLPTAGKLAINKIKKRKHEAERRKISEEEEKKKKTKKNDERRG